MTYTKQTWKNLPVQTTPVSAARLNHLETQFDEAKVYTDPQIAANPGSDGADGASGTITSTTAETISHGVAPSVILGGTPTARTMKFMIPEGSPGAQGNPTTVNGKTGASITLTASDLGQLAQASAYQRVMQSVITETFPGMVIT